MVQVLQTRRESPLTKLLTGFGTGLGAGLQEGIKKFENKQRIKKALPQLGFTEEESKGISSLPEELMQLAVKSKFDQIQRRALLSTLFPDQTQPAAPQGNIPLEQQPQDQQQPSQLPQPQLPQPQLPQQRQQPTRKPLSDELIAEISLQDSDLGRVLQSQNKLQQQRFEAERKYHAPLALESEKEVRGIRGNLVKKENALNLARDAIETGNLTYFSPDKLADITGIDLFRTAKGSQLIVASKENLLTNMSRVSARAQNQWFEQRLNSMFAKIGQSKEANLTAQTMLEGEVALDRAYVESFDKVSEADMNKFGYVRRDVEKRARDAVKPQEDLIMNSTAYKLREQYELEKGKGLNLLQKVTRGTPLTLEMARKLEKRTQDRKKAIQLAEKLGYTIPSLKEVQYYLQ